MSNAPNSATSPELAALLQAAERGDLPAATAALNAAPELLNQRGEARPGTGLRTALHFGVGHLEVVRELLHRGADPNLRDQGEDAMPLHFAAERGNLEVVRELVEQGADPIGAGTLHKLDVLGWATVLGKADPKLVAYLLAHGARHTLPSAAATGDVAVLRTLAAAGADLNLRLDAVNRRRSLLHLAVVKRQPAALAALIELGVPVEAADAAGLTALDQAALAQQVEMAAQLEAAGAEIRLPAAIGLGREERVQALLERSPSAVQPGGQWSRLIHRAAEHGSTAMIERLARAGAAFWIEDDPAVAVDGARGYTPLHAAAWHGNTDAARALIRLGAPISPRESKYCGTPAGWADYARHFATRDAILEGECDIWDAIAYDRRERVAAILLRDPEARLRRFRTYAACGPNPEELPLDRARALGRADIATLLAAAGHPLDTVAADFLRFACWDNDTHGRPDHRMHDRAAQRLLALHPAIAHDSLYTAIVCGQLEEVRRRLAADPALARLPGGPRQWPPLLYLCFTRFTHPPAHENAVAIARLLLDAGADPNAFYPACDSPYTALVGVAAWGEQDALRQPQSEALYRLLLERGAGPYDKQVLYNTHFYGDVFWWLRLTYERAVAVGRASDWDDPAWPMFDMGRYGTGATFLARVARRSHDAELGEWLARHGARPDAAPDPLDPPIEPAVTDAADARATSALLRAAKHLDTAEVARLLDLGVPVTAAGPHGDHALHHAAFEDGLETMELLLARGADANGVESRYHSTPFGWACHAEARHAIARLLPISHDVWALAFHGQVARLREVLRAHPELARQVNADGYTPLWWLPDDDPLEVVELLLAAGADPAHRNPQGHTAADWARRRGMIEVADRLSPRSSG